MDDATANDIKASLDSALLPFGPNIGIGFGLDLFNEFRKRSWFTLEVSGPLKATIYAGKVPMYGHTHFAFASWGIPEMEYEIGKDVK